MVALYNPHKKGVICKIFQDKELRDVTASFGHFRMKNERNNWRNLWNSLCGEVVKLSARLESGIKKRLRGEIRGSQVRKSGPGAPAPCKKRLILLDRIITDRL
jgi:hypothetical protein